LSNHKEQVLKEIGIPRWRTRLKELSAREQEVSERHESTEKVIEDASSNVSCPSYLTRNFLAIGEGSTKAKLLIVGEAPAVEGNKQDLPFVREADLLLEQMIFSCMKHFGEVYVANVVKCRTSGDSIVEKSEIDSCLEFLLEQVRRLSFKGSLVLGETAAHTLLDSDASLAELRGKVHHSSIVKIPMVVTYHPAYLLRSPLEKAKSWEDLSLLRTIFGEAE
tara:strand:+ start:244 stop:906 length:663 start_codon:yes stop_codon:yes gene_type:complete